VESGLFKDKSLFLAKKLTKRILPLRQWDFNCQARAAGQIFPVGRQMKKSP
jgi:hypothetical protein